MAQKWINLAGTVLGYIRLGLSGVRLKNASGSLSVRNAADSADAVVLPQSLGTGSRDGQKYLRDDGTWQYVIYRGADNVPSNTVYGENALANVGSSGQNVVIGKNAIAYYGVLSNNVVIGFEAGRDFNGASNNVVVGSGAMISGGFVQANTALGYQSIAQNTSSDFNTGCGAFTLGLLTSGDRNTALGGNALFLYQSGDDATSMTNCTGLGSNTAVSGDNQVQLGDSATTTYTYGAVQNRSDIRDKADVRDTTLGLAFIEKLRAVDFRWNYREDYKEGDEPGSKVRSRYHHGLIAQEVEAVMRETGLDFGGFQDHSINGGCDVKSIGYSELIGPLIKAVQELSARVKELESR